MTERETREGLMFDDYLELIADLTNALAERTSVSDPYRRIVKQGNAVIATNCKHCGGSGISPYVEFADVPCTFCKAHR